MLEIAGVAGLPEIHPGDDLAALLVDCLVAGEPGTGGLGALRPGDVVVFTSKIVSKAEGRLVNLDKVVPSMPAQSWAALWNKDPRQVEVVLRESRRIVRMDRGVIIAETRHGLVCANAGVDASNAGGTGTLVLLPEDPDASARRLREALRARTGVDVAVIITDTFGRPWRNGQTNIAIGASGLPALRDYAGEHDPDGYPLRVTSIAVIDELAAAAELVMHKLARVPVAVIRGYVHADSGRQPEEQPGAPEAAEGAAALVREAALDLFR